MKDPLKTCPLLHKMLEWGPYLDKCWEVQQDMEQIEDVLYKVG